MCALQSPNNAETRTRLLSKIEQDPDSTLQTWTVECQRLKNLKHDFVIVEQSSSSLAATSVHAITHTKSMSLHMSQDSISKNPPKACWQCRNWHFVRFCPFKKHGCQKCPKRGHKEDYCRPGQPSKSKVCNRRRRRLKYSSVHSGSESHSILAACKTEVEARRKYATVIIIGKAVRFQLDTASDIKLISKRIWHMLRRPPVVTSKKKALNVSEGIIQLTSELKCGVYFDGIQFKGTCFLTNHPNLNLLGLDWMEKLGLLESPLNRVCISVQSSWMSPANSNQLTAKLMSTLQEKFASIFQDGLVCCTKMKFTHLPLSFKNAPAIFQQTMNTMLTGTEGAAAYLDDIIITDSNQDERLQLLETVLSQIQDYDFHLCQDKCNF
ncbi:unnamed protein product [Schistocephalus solidus]|uniref:Reverse transcriptase domain-containing protein n=1 Tax=Schistocephalus solidus TaxID=70667 RepID=A0A183SFW2_SCHSO|nr:unnamed protein product [Schistocephalus solidus]